MSGHVVYGMTIAIAPMFWVPLRSDCPTTYVRSEKPTRANSMAGQRPFGFHGVYNRLATRLKLVDVHLGLGPNAEGLVDAWSHGLGLGELDGAKPILTRWSASNRHLRISSRLQRSAKLSRMIEWIVAEPSPVLAMSLWAHKRGSGNTGS